MYVRIRYMLKDPLEKNGLWTILHQENDSQFAAKNDNNNNKFLSHISIKINFQQSQKLKLAFAIKDITFLLGKGLANTKH